VTEDLEDLKRRLVVGRKRDGRSVYDEEAKAEFVALCLRPDVSVARLAREFGVNANQVARWLRERGQGQRRAAVGVAATRPAPAQAAFVAVPVVRPIQAPAVHDDGPMALLVMQARLPNGVAVDLRGVHPRDIGDVFEALGRLRCSVSTKG
jgi:transposase